MRRPISPALHSMLDYSSAAAAAVAPRLLDMPPAAARACAAFVAGYTPMAALTDTPAAIGRTVPLHTHRAVDRALPFVLPALPWLLGFARHRGARNFFLGLAAVTVVVTLLTDWDADAARRPAR